MVYIISKAKNILSDRIHNLEYLRSTKLGFKGKGIRKSEFVAKTHFLSPLFIEFYPIALDKLITVILIYGFTAKFNLFLSLINYFCHFLKSIFGEKICCKRKISN